MPESTLLEIGYFSFEPLSPRGLEKKLADALMGHETIAHADEASHTVMGAHYDFPFVIKVMYGLSIAQVVLSPLGAFLPDNYNHVRRILQSTPEYFDSSTTKLHAPQKPEYVSVTESARLPQPKSEELHSLPHAA